VVINDIYTYLGEETDLTAGTDLFKSRQTESPNNQVVIYDTGGLEPDRYLPTADPTFQVLVRNTSYATGQGIVDDIVDALHQKTNIELVSGSIYFYYIFLFNEPSHIGRDDKGRHEFSINFVCKYRR
jgi:hypothetical protein